MGGSGGRHILNIRGEMFEKPGWYKDKARMKKKPGW
jgi:hypothetical protein